MNIFFSFFLSGDPQNMRLHPITVDHPSCFHCGEIVFQTLCTSMLSSHYIIPFQISDLAHHWQHLRVRRPPAVRQPRPGRLLRRGRLPLRLHRHHHRIRLPRTLTPRRVSALLLQEEGTAGNYLAAQLNGRVIWKCLLPDQTVYDNYYRNF